MLYINTLFHFNRLHTTAKAVSEAEYSAYGPAKPGPQGSQVHCIIIIIIIIIIIGAQCMNRMIDLSDWCSRCMVCARLMHKKNTSKDCDKRDNNNNNNNNTVEPPCATTSCKPAPPISDHLPKITKFSQLKLSLIAVGNFHKRPPPVNDHNNFSGLMV